MAPTPAGKAAKGAAKKASPKKAAPQKKATAKAAPVKKTAQKKVAPVKKATDKAAAKSVRASSSFDAAFLEGQRAALLDERAALLGQAERLEDEAAALMEDQETGDVQFDDESGEGDSLAVERERDLALSAQARQMVADIDAALARVRDGTYGYSVVSGKPIPKERLRAIPWATELVEEKVGGLGRR
jgi:RNA polymerase-binding transcription factor DksA